MLSTWVPTVFGIVGLREADELRRSEGYRSACAGRRTQRLHREIEEAVVMGNDRTADGEIHIVRVEWLVWTRFETYEVLIGEHSLVVEPVRRGTVELIGARSGGEDRLQTGGAAVLAPKTYSPARSFPGWIRAAG